MCNHDEPQEWESNYRSEEFCPHCEMTWDDCECTPNDRCPICFSTDRCGCPDRWPDGEPDCMLD